MKTRAFAILVWVALLGVPFGLLGGLLVHQLWVGGFAELSTVLGTQWRLLGNTLLFGASTALLAGGLAWLLAHVQHHYRFRGRSVVHWLALAPLVMPSFTFAMALVIVFGHNGWLAKSIGTPVEIYGLGGLIVAGTLARLPYAYVALLAAHRSIHPDLNAAASELGATGWRRLRTVSWPKLRLPLLGVVLLVFADTVADLANPLVVGGSFRVVSLRLYEAVTGEGDLSSAAAYATLLLLPALAYLLAARRRAPRPTGLFGHNLEGLGLRPGNAGRALIAVAWIVCLFGAVLLGVVGVAALLPPGGPSLAAFAELFGEPNNRTIAWSVLLALAVVPLAVLGAMVAALAVAPHRQWVEGAIRWCGAFASVPSVVLGFGAFLALVAVRALGWVAPGWGVLPVVLAIAVVLLIRSFCAVAPLLLSRARDLVPETRGVAVSLGAKPTQLVRLVYFPRLRDAVGSGVVISTARTLTATSSVILLSDVQVPLLTVRTLLDVSEGRFAVAAVLTLVTGALIASVALLVRLGWRRG